MELKMWLGPDYKGLICCTEEFGLYFKTVNFYEQVLSFSPTSTSVSNLPFICCVQNKPSEMHLILTSCDRDSLGFA